MTNDNQGLQRDLFAASCYRSCLHISRRRTAGCLVYTRYSLNFPSRTQPYLFLEQSFFICHLILRKKRQGFFRSVYQRVCTSLSQAVHVTKIFRISHVPAQPIIMHQSQKGAGIAHFRSTIIRKQQDMSESRNISLKKKTVYSSVQGAESAEVRRQNF